MGSTAAGVGHDVRLACRRLLRAPAFAAAALVTLALGVAMNAAVFAAVDAVLLRPLPFEEQDRLVVVWKRIESGDTPFAEVSLPDFRDWRSSARSFHDMAAYSSTPWGTVLRYGDRPLGVRYAAVTGTFFQTLGARAALGRVLGPQDGEPGAPAALVLGYPLWQRAFGGDPGVVGRALRLDGWEQPATVVGVMPQGFGLPEGAELWAPIDPSLPRHVGVLFVVGRLAPGASQERARAELDTIVADLLSAHYPESDPQRAILTPIEDVVLGEYRPALQALWVAVALVLVLVWLNVTGLLLARGLDRRGEMEIRQALGAGRRRLVRQLAVENSLLALTGCALGVLLASPALRALVGLAPSDVARLDAAAFGARALAFTGAVAGLTALVVAFGPALRAPLSRTWGGAALLARGQTPDRQRRSLARALVVAEVGLAMALLVAGGFLLRAFLELRSVALGYEPRGVLTVDLGLPHAYETVDRKNDFYDRLIERVEAAPGVQAAGAVANRPFVAGSVGWDAWLIAEGQYTEMRTMEVTGEDGRARTVRSPAESGAWVQTNWQVATPGYFRAMGTPLVAGRDFDRNDREDSPSVVILGRSLARRLWGDEDPIGRRVLTYGSRWDEAGEPIWQEVVGVVPDGRYRELRRTRLDVYLPHRQAPVPPGSLVLRVDASPAGLAPVVREAIRALEPAAAVGDVTTLASTVASQRAPWRFLTVTLAALASAAMLLAGMGIFGSLAHSVAQRVREIGVRVSLGATPPRIAWLVLSEGIAIASLGICLGLWLGLASVRALEGLLFGVSPFDVATPLVLAAFLGAVALVACLLPLRTALRVDPAQALRAEA